MLDKKKIASCNIREQFFDSNDAHVFKQFASYKLSRDAMEGLPFHYIVYINEPRSLPFIWIHSSLPFTDEYLSRPSFKDYLQLLPVFNYHTLLFAIMAYTHLDFSSFIRAVKDEPVQQPGNVPWHIVKDSFGYLVYAHQLEQLYSEMIGSNNEEAVLFRKNWNAKRNEARKAAKSIINTDGLSLYEIIVQNTVDKRLDNHFVYQAPYNAAYTLMNYLR